MKFFLDHDVPGDIALLLRYWGHEATVLRDVLPVAASDEEALSVQRFPVVCRPVGGFILRSLRSFLAKWMAVFSEVQRGTATRAGPTKTNVARRVRHLRDSCDLAFS